MFFRGKFFAGNYFAGLFFGSAGDTAQTISPAGVSDADDFGTPALALNVIGIGFPDGDAFGVPVVTTGAVTIEPSGFADGDAFGTPSLGVVLYPSGFADADAFGTPAVGLNIVGIGYSDPDAFGPPRLSLNIVIGSFVDPDAFGLPVVQAKKKNGQGGGGNPGGVAAGQKYATRITMTEAGLIVALEANANVAKTVNTRMGLYADVAGLPGALLAQSDVKTSVVVGGNQYPLIVPQASASGVSYWAALHTDGNFNWFLTSGPTSRFNADAFDDGLANPFGASTLDGNKAPVFLVYLQAITLNVTGIGVADGDAFGIPVVAPDQDIAVSGFADDDAFGVPALPIIPSGVASGNQFGLPLVALDQDIAVTGFADADAFGIPALAVQALPINVDGLSFADDDAFGIPTVTPDQAIEPTGFVDDDAFGILNVGAQDIAVDGFADDDAFGEPDVRFPSAVLEAVGFADADAFGSPTVTVAPLPVPSGGKVMAPRHAVATIAPHDVAAEMAPRRLLTDIFPNTNVRSDLVPRRKPRKLADVRGL